MTNWSSVHPFPWRRLKPVDRLFAQAERSIALISRARPTNAAAEQERLGRVWGAGKKELPRFRYAHVPELGQVRRRLERICELELEDDAVSKLYASRARELVLETQIVERIGTKELVVLSKRRFSEMSAEQEAQSVALAESWSALPEGQPEPTFRSDDSACPQSLVSQLRALVGRLKLPVTVELTGALTAAAATGERTIFVALGRALTEEASARIAHHEVHGHALPRLRAADEPLGLFAVGSARGNDEQEGYALWLEEQAQLMGNERKRELAFRHWAARSVQSGADFVETMEVLSERGAPLGLSLQIAGRAHRAGGLAREVVYLDGYSRVSSAAAEPGVIDWLSRGRLSLDAISVLRGLPDFSRVGS